MATEQNKPNDEAEIRQLVERYVRAVRAKDLDAVMSIYAPEIVSFDIEPPLQYVHTKRWEQTFATFQGSMDYEVRDLSVTASENVAFAYSLNRSGGTLKNGKKIGLWIRWTACFRKIHGRWLIAHDHVSVPMDFESGKALMDLKP